MIGAVEIPTRNPSLCNVSLNLDLIFMITVLLGCWIEILSLFEYYIISITTFVVGVGILSPSSSLMLLGQCLIFITITHTVFTRVYMNGDADSRRKYLLTKSKNRHCTMALFVIEFDLLSDMIVLLKHTHATATKQKYK